MARGGKQGGKGSIIFRHINLLYSFYYAMRCMCDHSADGGAQQIC